jgi:chondroitin AC lyase
MAFYKSGEFQIAKNKKIKMDSQGMAMLKMAGENITTVTVSDPSRSLGKILITLPSIYMTLGKGFLCLPDKKSNTTMIIIDLPQGFYSGKSVSVKL